MSQSDADTVKRALLDRAVCPQCKEEKPKKDFYKKYPSNPFSQMCTVCVDSMNDEFWNTPLKGSSHKVAATVGRRLRDL